MRPLTEQDTEAELSYAYLHAVAADVGAGCKVSSRHEDNAGVDACLTAWGPFPGGGYRTEIDLKVQLKATVADPVEQKGRLSYFLKEVHRYDDLRSNAVSTPRILVVLFLPKGRTSWLTLTAEELTLRKCAYWVNLRGAPATSNSSGVTVYLPTRQVLNQESLKSLFVQLSHVDSTLPDYELPDAD